MDETELTLRPVETRRASELIYEQIRESIVAGRLRPGDRLPSERAMMAMLQRSRPTIREALRMLERAGFIRSVAGSHGAVVQQPSTRGVEQSLDEIIRTSQVSFQEIAEYRSLNEAAVAGWAAERRSEADLAAIDGVMLLAASAVGDYERFILLDTEFHCLLARAAKNEVAVIMTKVLSRFIVELMGAKLSRLSEPERTAMCSRVLEMHRAVVAALHGHDQEAARAAMAEHVRAFIVDLGV